MATKWEGVFCALWTPTDENGRLLRGELKSGLDFLRQKKVHGLLPLGSTGEFLHLDLPARKKFLEEVMLQADGLRVLANISDIRPGVVAELGRFAREVGAEAVSILPPYFFPVAQADLVEFFVRAGEAAQIPVFLYNFPERTGNRIALETIATVADRIPLAGIKQSGGEFEYHRALVQLGRERNFVVFTGSDTRLPEAMALGVTGCVSGLSNAVPEYVLEIFHAVQAGEPGRAAAAMERMRTIDALVEQLEFPLNVAAIMEARGFSPGHPKSLVAAQTRVRYQKLVGDFRQLFLDWKLVA
jgi:4-hydroxy-tetrahydrodipicolinate synthase